MYMHEAVLAATLLAFATGAAAQAPNDAQTASIVVTANQVDIDAGKLGESKGHAAGVKAFARQMVTGEEELTWCAR